VVQLTGREVSQVAKLLGSSRTPLWKKMRRLKNGGD
jgi:biotin operon repressor